MAWEVTIEKASAPSPEAHDHWYVLVCWTTPEIPHLFEQPKTFSYQRDTEEAANTEAAEIAAALGITWPPVDPPTE